MTAATPTPRTLYVHDDLSAELATDGEATRRLGEALLALLRREPGRVVVLTLAEQLAALIAGGDQAPFPLAVGLGAAGARVAAQVHERTGWFPAIRRVEVWREEHGPDDYRLAGPAPLEVQLAGLPDVASLAVVDDTLFSGLTMGGVLTALPPRLRGRARGFCLRAVAESLAAVRRLAPVTVGFAAPGRLLTDVSFINASGLVRRGAIRRAGQPPLAFFEREEWMAAWFPGHHREILTLCRELSARLEAGTRGGCRDLGG
jgi:hypothetical protein